jgi:hypothetical protein
MTQGISPSQLRLLKMVASHHPDVAREHLSRAGATEADLIWLERNDLVRETEPGRLHLSHMGRQVLKRIT